MSGARLIAMLALMHAATVDAGHGFMNAFNDIEWLPAPGRTPDQLAYRLDLLDERARLALAGTPAAAFDLSLAFAREKLAEVAALVRREQAQAAPPAIAAYRDYLARAAAAITGSAAAERAGLRERFALALLEHRYLVSVDYLDLPRGARGVIAELVTAAEGHYTSLRSELPRAFRDTLFFKEEEVRWSWEMAQQADAQGL